MSCSTLTSSRSRTASALYSLHAYQLRVYRVTNSCGGGAQVEEDPTGGKFAGIGGALNSAHHKLEDIIQFHVGDVVTALQRAAMQPGGQEAVIYGTIMGALGDQLHPTPCRCCPQCRDGGTCTQQPAPIVVTARSRGPSLPRC